MGRSRPRIEVSGAGPGLSAQPFAGLNLPGTGVGQPAKSGTGVSPAKPSQRKSRGRVDVVRQKAGRGGKTVTVLSGFKGIGGTELDELAREIRRACGVGGTVKGGTIEIQGDQTERAMAILAEAGFQPVRAGG